MPGTFEALVVLLLAILPGAVYTWAFERIAGKWGVGLSDRLYRFIGITAAFQAAIAPVSYQVWENYLRSGAPDRHALPLWLWPCAIAYIAAPGVLGTVVAKAFQRGDKWAVAIVGSTAAPTAWDALFSTDPTDLFVLMRLKSGRWVGGQYAEGSYAAGYPEPADLYLVRELKVDQDKEDFERDDKGNQKPLGSFGLLVKWAEVEYLEVSD